LNLVLQVGVASLIQLVIHWALLRLCFDPLLTLLQLSLQLRSHALFLLPEVLHGVVDLAAQFLLTVLVLLLLAFLAV
jgi:hypothetical protein